ncbi:MAG: isopentenyl-diphosphate Delta-isomerase [Gammaproteobacteria bacterium]|nr:isopentenyl-diphosphate Delta-isomerase [Gammaproteobacteria bacterium]
MTATEHVILVDENDNPIGVAEKLKAHQDNLCHRAFSVFVFRNTPKPLLLLQQRADNKYHSGGLWTNTCCSHPRPGEGIIEAGERRLQEEMGLSASLESHGSFHYIAHFGNGLVENEIDHVLVGYTEHEKIELNPAEAKDYRWVSILELEQDLAIHPEQYTPWLKQALSLIHL